MGSSKKEIHWTTVPNTVESRMIDLSLVHQLIPCTKLPRRTKALNTAVKEYLCQSYSQYIKIKTSIIQNLPDNSDTDDDVSLNEEDFRYLYNSDLSLRKSVAHKTAKDLEFYQKEESDVDENVTIIEGTERKPRVSVRTTKPKSKRSKFVNLGWQRVIKKKSGTHSSPDKSRLSTASSQERKADENCEISTTASSPEIHSEALANDEKMTLTDSIAVREATDDSNGSINKHTTTSINKELLSNENQHNNIAEDNRSQALKGIKKNLTSILENVQDSLSNNTNIGDNLYLDKTLLSLSNAIPIGRSTPIQTKKSNTFLQIQRSVCNVNQPKDSGIDEDTEEESSEDGKRVIQQLPNIACDNDSKRQEQQDEAQKHKLHPKVTSTEVVNKRYRIISGSEPALDVCKEESESEDVTQLSDNEGKEIPEVEHAEDSMSPLSKRRLQQEIPEEVEYAEDSMSPSSKRRLQQEIPEEVEYAEDSMSPSSKRRLQQLKRLNLTIDSESSGDENECYDTQNTRNLLCEKSLECCEVSNKVTSIPSKESKTVHRKTKDVSEVQTSDKHPTIGKRPYNLQELIEVEDLLEETNISSFTLKDLYEDDIFILEIPKTVLESQLPGQKLVLTEKKLKVGKQKYKVLYNNPNVVSCVFSTGKSRKPYKAVNLKPIARIVARQKVTECSLRESPTRSLSNTESCAEKDSDVESNSRPPKRRRLEKTLKSEMP